MRNGICTCLGGALLAAGLLTADFVEEGGP
jgi:hypothetical protein